MNKDTKFSLHSRLKSFTYAFQGIIHFLRTEHNAWIHMSATIAVIIMAILVKVTRGEAIALVVAVAFVWITEMLNTSIEKAMDVVSQEYHPKIKIIKDLSAGAVLVAAIAAFLIGLIIFIPKFFLL